MAHPYNTRAHKQLVYSQKENREREIAAKRTERDRRAYPSYSNQKMFEGNHYGTTKTSKSKPDSQTNQGAD
jgi:hypothetical protein